MPPSFIIRISRSISGLVTDGPNHHQRIMILASSGGLTNDCCSWSMLADEASAGSRAIRKTDALRAMRPLRCQTPRPQATLVRRDHLVTATHGRATVGSDRRTIQ